MGAVVRATRAATRCGYPPERQPWLKPQCLQIGVFLKRLPEDASGTLQFGGAEASAMVVAQEGNRIWLLLESLEPLPPFLPTARLVLNETELLKRLREKIEALRLGSDLGLAPKVFGHESSKVGLSSAPIFVTEHLGPSDTARKPLEQCIGS